MSETEDAQPNAADSLPECFVVMPVTDPEQYDPGHFRRVFEDIFVPACAAAGYRAVRADDVRETNLIHLDILRRLLDTPMVLCDLSSRNPNVLFELGLRQAFDKPVVLVQEVGTPKIFDIAPLRLTEYRRGRIYHEVIEDQQRIADAVRATEQAHKRNIGVNSIVKILSLTTPASIPEVKGATRDPALEIIRAELAELRNDIRRLAARPPEVEPTASPNKRLALAVHSLASLLAVVERELSFEENRAVLAEAHDQLRDAFIRASHTDVNPMLKDKATKLERRYFELRDAAERLKGSSSRNAG